MELITKENVGFSNDCDGPSFDKLKFSNVKVEQKNLEESYQKGQIKDKILMEVVLNLDQFQTETVRQST